MLFAICLFFFDPLYNEKIALCQFGLPKLWAHILLRQVNNLWSHFWHYVSCGFVIYSKQSVDKYRKQHGFNGATSKVKVFKTRSRDLRKLESNASSMNQSIMLQKVQEVKGKRNTIVNVASCRQDKIVAGECDLLNFGDGVIQMDEGLNSKRGRRKRMVFFCPWLGKVRKMIIPHLIRVAGLQQESKWCGEKSFQMTVLWKFYICRRQQIHHQIFLLLWVIRGRENYFSIEGRSEISNTRECAEGISPLDWTASSKIKQRSMKTWWESWYLPKQVKIRGSYLSLLRRKLLLMTKNLNKNNEKQFKTNVVARNNGQKGIGVLTAEKLPRNRIAWRHRAVWSKPEWVKKDPKEGEINAASSV